MPYQDVVFRFRTSPGTIALTAGAIGLICGALAVTSGPPTPPAQVAAKPPVETTGSAPAVHIKAAEEPTKTAEVLADTSAQSETSSECDQQTWPYITQQCLIEREATQRKVRVITTDRIAPPVVTAIEAERDVQRVREKPAKVVEPPRETVAAARVESQSEPTVPATAAKPEPPAPAKQGIAAAVVFDPTPASPVAATIEPAKPAPAAEPTPVAETPKPAPAAEPAPARRTAATHERSQKATNAARTKSARDTRKQEARRLVSAQDRDRVEDSRTTPSARIVERWTEREYEVPSESGGPRRRVVVRSGDPRPSIESRPSTEYQPAGLFGAAFR